MPTSELSNQSIYVRSILDGCEYPAYSVYWK